MSIKNKYNFINITKMLIIIIAINILLPSLYVKSEEKVSIFNNGGFESGTNYWYVWRENNNLNSEIDSNIKYEGDKSIKIYNNTNNVTRGILSQKAAISSNLGKTIKLSQNIKTEKLIGEIQIKVKFLDEQSNIIEEKNVKNVFNDLEGDIEWESRELEFNIPLNANIKYLMVEYIYNKAKGAIWIDNIKSEIIEKDNSIKIISNGGFTEKLSYWDIYRKDYNFNVYIDNNNYKNTKNSIKLYNNSTNATRGIISQIANVQEYKGKSICMEQWIKSDNFTGSIEIRSTFIDNNGEYIGKADIKKISIDNKCDWILKKSIIDIPNDNDIKNVKIEIILSNLLGSIWIDDISTQIVESNNSSNIIKNNGFEEDLSYWEIWKSSNNLNINIDNNTKINGNNSLRLNNDSENNARGIVSQKVSIEKYLGKDIKINQSIKSQELIGELQLKFKFVNENSDVINTKEIKNLYNSLEGNIDWENKEFIINIPKEKEIEYLIIEYIYNNSVGSIWIDNIEIDIVEHQDEINRIENGDFENKLAYWDTFKSDSNFNIKIDDTQYKVGEKSINFYNTSSNKSRGMISQIFKVNDLIGSAIELQQWVKSKDFSGNIEVRSTFYNSSNNLIGDADSKKLLVGANEEWQNKRSIINIPNNSEINYIKIDFIINNLIGYIWVDSIVANDYVIEKSDNIVKNCSFEEELSYWNIWKENNNFIIDIDKNVKYIGNNSLRISSSDNKARGIISQEVIIPQEYQNETLKVSQWIRTSKLYGEAVRARINFKDKDGNIISPEKVITLDIESNQDWNNIYYNIIMPNEKKVDKILIEYIYDSFSGSIWFDDIIISRETEKLIENIIKNNSFESTIKSPVTDWFIRDDNEKIEYSVDNTNSKHLKNSLKISAKNDSNSPRIAQSINVTSDLLGKSLKISEYIKTDNRNSIYKTIQFLDSNGNKIGESTTWSVALNNYSVWNENSNSINIPNNEDIKTIVLEYTMKNMKGSIWLDDIEVNPYTPIDSISINSDIIEIKKGESIDLKIEVKPDNNSNNFIIESNDKNIINIKNNNIKAVNKGITKIRISENFEGKIWEFPVVVYDNILDYKIVRSDITAKQGEQIKEKIDLKDLDESTVKHTVLVEGNSGNIDLKSDGSFIYYLNYKYYGEDTIIIVSEDKNNKMIIQQYNILVNRSDLNLSKDNFVITLTENSSIKGRLSTSLSEKLVFNIDKNTYNGKFEIDSEGNYKYTPKKNFYGYDEVYIKVQTYDNQESIIEGTIYVAPSKDTMIKSISKSYPRVLASKNDFLYIKDLIEKDSIAKEWFRIIKKDADKIVDLPIVGYNISDGLRLDTSAVQYIQKLSFMYLLTNDEKYADRAWKEIYNVCSYPNWNESHFLDTAEIITGISIAYDWLNEYLSTEQKSKIEKAIINKGLEKGVKYYSQNSGFTTMNNNWNIVCNSAMILSSLAISNQDNYDFTLDITQKAMISIQNYLKSYYIDGSSFEGTAYWSYSTEYLIYAISSIKNILKISRPFNNMINLEDMGDFAVQMSKGKDSFNYGDAGSYAMKGYFGLWFSKELNNSKYTEATKIYFQNTNLVDIYNLLWYRKDLYNKGNLPQLDKYFSKNQIVTMRSSYINDYSTFLAFKGGTTGLEHSDLDIGTFVYDALGVRWALELGSENYNLPGYWEDNKLGQRWDYYRKRAEGHNTLVIGDSSNEDQVVGSTSKIVDLDINSDTPYAILDMTPAYENKAINITRKFELNNDRKNLIIEDNFFLLNEEEVIWQMHSDADIKIQENGKSAILTKEGQSIKINVMSNSDFKLEIVDAKPLDSSPNPENQNSNLGIKKIIIKVKAKSGNIRVEMLPMGDHNAMKKRLINSNFENKLEKWILWNSSKNFAAIEDSNIKKEGEYSAKLYSDDGNISRGSISQAIDMSNYYGNTLKLSQWIKSEDLNGKFKIRYNYLDEEGKEISSKVSTTLIDSQNIDWTFFEVDIDIPKNTKKVVIEYLFDNCSGSVWIDNINQVILEGDLNEDGLIDIIDLASISIKYNIYNEENSNYSKFDLNKDNIVDIYDIVYIAKKL